MFNRPILGAASIAALLALSACTATVTAPDTQTGKQIEPTQSLSIAVSAADSLHIDISGGMPSPCAKGIGTADTTYDLDFAKMTLRYVYVAACHAADGTASTTEKSVTLSAADRDALLDKAGRLVLEPITECTEDAPDQTVIVDRANGTTESHPVDEHTCKKGQGIRATEYQAMLDAITALIK